MKNTKKFSVAGLIKDLVEKSDVNDAKEFKEKYLKDFAKSLKFYKEDTPIPETLDLSFVKAEMASLPDDSSVQYGVVVMSDGTKDYRLSLRTLYKGLGEDNEGKEISSITLSNPKKSEAYEPQWAKKGDRFVEVSWQIDAIS